MRVVLLFAAAVGLFSIQNICFKQFNRRFMTGPACYFMFSAMYFTLIAGIFIIIGLDAAYFTPPVVFLGLLFAVSFICAMFLYMKAMEHGPMGLSFLFFSAGMIWPILFGVFVYGEPAPPHKAAGLLLLFAAFYFSTREPGAGEKLNRKWAVYILSGMCCNGVIGVAQKLFRAVAPNEAVNEFLFLSFAQAAVIAFIAGVVWMILKKETLAGIRHIHFVWVVLGAAVSTAGGNFAIIALSLMISALVQFPVMNGALAIASILISRIVFNETITKNHMRVIIIGLTAVVTISV